MTDTNIWVWRGYNKADCKQIDVLVEGTDREHAISKFHAKGYTDVCVVALVNDTWWHALSAGTKLEALVSAHSLKTVVTWLTMLCDENDNDTNGAWARDCDRLGALVEQIEN